MAMTLEIMFYKEVSISELRKRLPSATAFMHSICGRTFVWFTQGDMTIEKAEKIIAICKEFGDCRITSSIGYPFKKE